jgi:hypothetical protein
MSYAPTIARGSAVVMPNVGWDGRKLSLAQSATERILNRERPSIDMEFVTSDTVKSDSVERSSSGEPDEMATATRRKCSTAGAQRLSQMKQKMDTEASSTSRDTTLEHALSDPPMAVIPQSYLSDSTERSPIGSNSRTMGSSLNQSVPSVTCTSDPCTGDAFEDKGTSPTDLSRGVKLKYALDEYAERGWHALHDPPRACVSSDNTEEGRHASSSGYGVEAHLRNIPKTGSPANQSVSPPLSTPLRKSPSRASPSQSELTSHTTTVSGSPQRHDPSGPAVSRQDLMHNFPSFFGPDGDHPITTPARVTIHFPDGTSRPLNQTPGGSRNTFPSNTPRLTPHSRGSPYGSQMLEVPNSGLRKSNTSESISSPQKATPDNSPPKLSSSTRRANNSSVVTRNISQTGFPTHLPHSSSRPKVCCGLPSGPPGHPPQPHTPTTTGEQGLSGYSGGPPMYHYPASGKAPYPTPTTSTPYRSTSTMPSVSSTQCRRAPLAPNVSRSISAPTMQNAVLTPQQQYLQPPAVAPHYGTVRGNAPPMPSHGPSPYSNTNNRSQFAS